MRAQNRVQYWYIHKRFDVVHALRVASLSSVSFIKNQRCRYLSIHKTHRDKQIQKRLACSPDTNPTLTSPILAICKTKASGHNTDATRIQTHPKHGGVALFSDTHLRVFVAIFGHTPVSHSGHTVKSDAIHTYPSS
jgi:hypothetical protein